MSPSRNTRLLLLIFRIQPIISSFYLTPCILPQMRRSRLYWGVVFPLYNIHRRVWILVPVWTARMRKRISLWSMTAPAVESNRRKSRKHRQEKRQYGLAEKTGGGKNEIPEGISDET